MKKQFFLMFAFSLFLGVSTSAHEGEESHEHEEDVSDKVGPNKGILEADEHLGFKLSPEAMGNFEIQSRKLDGNGPWSIPASAVLQSGEEVNIYRVRDGFMKRIDFDVKQKQAHGLLIVSKDLRAGDEIVSNGLGFLRIAELAAFGGVADGHSH